MNDEGILSFKAIFPNDLYLEQVNYKWNGVSQNIFHYLIVYSRMYKEESV